MFRKHIELMKNKIIEEYLSKCSEEVSARLSKHEEELLTKNDEHRLDELMGVYLSKNPNGTLHGFKRFVAFQS